MPKHGHNDDCLPPAVLEIHSQECPVIFHKVTIPAEMGDDEAYPPTPGLYRNVVLVYEANSHVWMYSSDGIPTFISNGEDAGTVDYNELENKPSINEHVLTGDSSLSDIGVTDAITTALSDYTPTGSLAAVALSGDYGDLLNKPTIPVVNDATLTIQKNSTDVGTFTANASSNKTINITVPTTAADVSALPASTKYGASISVSINTTDYKMTTTLKDQDGNTLGTAQVIDLPLESVVVNGSYDSANKKIVLTLQNGNTIDIPVGDLISGLQTEITSSNKLASDLVDDTGQTNKFNMQADWSQTTVTAGDYIKNKPTIPAAQVNSDWNANSGVAQILNKPNLATVATTGSYPDLHNRPTIGNGTLTIQKNGTQVATFTANQTSGSTANITVPTNTSDLVNNGSDGTSTYVEASGLATVATSGLYSDLTGTPTIPTKTSDLTNDGADNTSTYVEADELATVATSGSYNDLSNKPTIMTGLVEMSYGESNAWAKFIAAYQAKQIVYCRASSNSNPATGSQTRKAFMAYVNNADNPTEVEFQYVRSVSSKTSSQPVDQVFVYKLTSASGGTWTVQTRNMGPKLADGTNTTVNYSNGTYTIDAAQPTVPTKTSDLQNDGSDGTSTYVEADELATVATSGSYTDLSNKPTIPANTSDLNNDSGFVTSMDYASANDAGVIKVGAGLAISSGGVLSATGGGVADSVAWGHVTGTMADQTDLANALAAKVDSSSLATVATSGSYNDLLNTPTIPAAQIQSDWTQADNTKLDYIKNKPSIPTVNNATLTITQNGTSAGTFTANASSNKTIALTDTTYSDATTSASGLMSSTDKTKLNSIATGAEVNVQANWTEADSSSDAYILNKPSLATVATSGSYNDLSNKPTIPAAQVNSDWDAVSGVAQILNKPNLAAVATTGSYTDLIDQPTIPTVNNATLTIQKNGTTVNTFTANASSNKTANITVPTTVAELSDASNYATTSALAGKQNTLTAGDHISISSDTISAVDYVHSESPVTLSSPTPVVTGSMIASGTITASNIAAGEMVTLTLSTTDIGEGAALAANTLYGVYQ